MLFIKEEIVKIIYDKYIDGLSVEDISYFLSFNEYYGITDNIINDVIDQINELK